MEKTNEMKQTKGPNCTRLVDSGNKVHDLDKYGSQNCDVFQNGFRPMFGNIHSESSCDSCSNCNCLLETYDAELENVT